MQPKRAQEHKHKTVAPLRVGVGSLQRGSERDLVAAFSFPYSRECRETLVHIEWGDEIAAQLADVQIEMRGLTKTIDALVMIAANHSCDHELPEIEQNAWRRAANALVEARKCAQAGGL